MSYNLTINANFRTGTSLPSIEDQYASIWRFAKILETVGFPIDQWFPPADTEANSFLNKAFNETGPSAAALAMAYANKDNLATDLRSLGAWNGKEGDGGAAFTTMYNTSQIPSNLSFMCQGDWPILDYGNMVKVVQGIVNLWKPMLIQIAPAAYLDRSVFPDRPGAGWMLYLPFVLQAQQVPEASHIMKFMDDTDKTPLGSLIVTIEEALDDENPEHIKRANAIETRLVDQDLLPTNNDFVTKF